MNPKVYQNKATGQKIITIPKHICETLRIRDGDRVKFEIDFRRGRCTFAKVNP